MATFHAVPATATTTTPTTAASPATTYPVTHSAANTATRAFTMAASPFGQYLSVST
ncbi:hypothetical protein ACFP1Z_02075 [Streptomyces gamaensis]|uniref:Uncharacterized protein n=1 Tax=Streptomyces gamaensis TaxID=1763542 RepID=A0ABW0YVY3_9ACTN